MHRFHKLGRWPGLSKNMPKQPDNACYLRFPSLMLKFLTQIVFLLV